MAMIRFDIGVDGDEMDDISSTSKCPHEFVAPFVVIEILCPACLQSARRLER